MKCRNLPFYFLAMLPALVLAQGFDKELDDDEPLTSTADTPAGVTPPAAAPTPSSSPKAPHVEEGPSDLKTYISNGKTPRYMRINLKGYNIRKNSDFSPKSVENIDFRSKGGDVFAVASVQPMAYGAAVQVHVDDETRWVYVPHAKKDDFQFCESEACFSALADSLDFFLHGSGVNMSQARSCGVSSGPEGLILPSAAPEPLREPDPVLKPAPVALKPQPIAAGNTAMSVKPLWEKAKGAQGRKWTGMMSNALDKFGKGLLGRKNISDARSFCPNYSRLTPAQRKEFYIHLFNGISRYESNFKTSFPAFDEDRYSAGTPPYNIFSGAIKPNAYSMGLFQLSYSAAGGYKPECRIDYKKDRGKSVSDPSLTIYDPQIQMECAVVIMNRWVSRDGGIGLTRDVRDSRTGRTRYRGGANYWSTLRNTNPATAQVIGSLKRFTPCWK